MNIDCVASSYFQLNPSVLIASLLSLSFYSRQRGSTYTDMSQCIHLCLKSEIIHNKGIFLHLQWTQTVSALLKNID